jgi:hypothetical protein
MGFAPLGVQVGDFVCDFFRYDLQVVVRHRAEGSVIVSTAWFARIENEIGIERIYDTYTPIGGRISKSREIVRMEREIRDVTADREDLEEIVELVTSGTP